MCVKYPQSIEKFSFCPKKNNYCQILKYHQSSNELRPQEPQPLTRQSLHRSVQVATSVNKKMNIFFHILITNLCCWHQRWHKGSKDF